METQVYEYINVKIDHIIHVWKQTKNILWFLDSNLAEKLRSSFQAASQDNNSLCTDWFSVTLKLSL